MASQIAACQLDETAIFRRNQNFMLKLGTSSIEWRGFKTTKKWPDMPSNQHLQFQTPNKGSFKPPLWENQSILLKKISFGSRFLRSAIQLPKKATPNYRSAWRFGAWQVQLLRRQQAPAFPSELAVVVVAHAVDLERRRSCCCCLVTVLILLICLCLLMVSFQPLHALLMYVSIRIYWYHYVSIYLLTAMCFCCTSRSSTISNSWTVGPGPPWGLINPKNHNWTWWMVINNLFGEAPHNEGSKTSEDRWSSVVSTFILGLP